MTFWIQHGYGKSNKISYLSDAGVLTGGVILSPGDEDLGALSTTVAALREDALRVLLDPQFYIYSIQGASARCHPDNGIAFEGVSWFVSPGEMEAHIEAIYDLNRRLSLVELIAPGPYVASFGDVWAPISLQYLRAFNDAVGEGAVFASVVAEDIAFADWETTTRWLDALTTIDCHGIYLIVGHSGRTYPFAWEPDHLANVLRVIYVLCELNQYEVVWGYSDVGGLLGLAAGASGLATGWYHSLRFWTPQKWKPQTGGRQANPRVFLVPLLSPLEARGEATSTANSALGEEAFADAELLHRFRQDDPAWGITDTWYQHMEALATEANRVSAEDSVLDRIRLVDDRLREAERLIDRLGDSGVALAPAHTTRVTALRRGLATFVNRQRL